MAKRKRNFSYLRLSKEDGDLAGEAAPESCSIGAQRRCIQQYISAHPEVGDGFEELVDDGYSGTNFDRPGVTQLLQWVESEQVGTIIVRDLSRFARNYLEAGHFLEFVFPAYGIRFISINDHYDSAALGESTAGFQLALRNLMNELYSRDISRKIRSAVDLKKLSGEYVYGAVPYGYQKGGVKNTIVVDEGAATTVREIFRWAAEGVTVTQIAARLNEAGTPTPSQYLQSVRGKYKTRPYWTFDSVRNILMNRIYTGDTVPFKSHVVRVGSNRVKRVPEQAQLVIPETHEAIVTREQYTAARSVMQGKQKSRPRQPSSMLAPYLSCGCCGNRLSKGRATNQNFKCATARYAPAADCRAVQIDEARISAVLLSAIQCQCNLLDAKVQAARTVQTKDRAARAALYRALVLCRNRVEQSQLAQMQLYEDYVSGTLEKETLILRKAAEKAAAAEAELRQKRLEEQMAALTAQADQRERAIAQTQGLTQYAQISGLSGALLRELVQKIIVFPGGAIQIVWNFRDEFPAG